MAVLTVYARTADPVFVAAGGSGDTFVNNGDTELIIVNAGIADVDVTIAATNPCRQGFTDDWVVTCEGQELTRIGPFDATRFNSSLGVATVTYDDETNLTIAAQRLR